MNNTHINNNDNDNNSDSDNNTTSENQSESTLENDTKLNTNKHLDIYHGDYYAYLSNHQEKKPLLTAIKDILPILDWIKTYSFKDAKGDIIAGFITALIVIPQCIAFTAIAGIPAKYGFYTAIVIPWISVFFASSRHMVNGPTIAVSMLLASMAGAFDFPAGSPNYVHIVLTLTFLGGIFQVALYLLRFDFLLRFVSNSVLKAFTAGAAVLIVLKQIKTALGFHFDQEYEMWHGLYHIATEFSTGTNFLALTISVITIILTVLLSTKISSGLANLASIIIMSVIAYLVTTNSPFSLNFAPQAGHITPTFILPRMNFSEFEHLALNGFGLSIISLISAISIASALSEKTHQKIDTRQEVFNQGISNALGSFFGIMLSCGSFSRSGLNLDSGARTPMAGIVTSITVTIALLFGGSILHRIPIPVISGIILLIGIKLIKFKQILEIIKRSRSERFIIAVTFFSAILLGLQNAIYFGVFASLMIFIIRTTKPRIFVLEYLQSKRRFIVSNTNHETSNCPQIIMIRIQGAIYYGSSQFVEEAIKNIINTRNNASLIMICGEGITNIDWDGAHVLNSIVEKHQGRLCIASLGPNILNRLHKYGIHNPNILYSGKHQALSALYKQLDYDQCKACTNPIFQECFHFQAGRSAEEIHKQDVLLEQ